MQDIVDSALILWYSILAVYTARTVQRIAFYASLHASMSIQLTSNVDEGFLIAWNCQSTHWMIVAVFFFGMSEQVLE
ncbi:hypothetical protein SOVF_098910 [Spinacia oleracea]|nr:hypothetical protein SOVF_098910 [Spinacia oleracea]